MSAYYITAGQNGAILASDTLNVVAEDSTPAVFGHKTFTVPHLNMMVAVSGFGALMPEWYAQLKFNCTKNDIASLHEVTPEILREAYGRFKLTYNPTTDPPGPGGTKVYHVGYSQREDEYVAYGYYSGNDFEGEKILGAETSVDYAQPIGPEIRDAFRKDQGPIERIVDYFKKVHEVDQQKPAGERIAVGGEVWMHTLVEGQIDTRRIHVYDDYEETAAAIAKNDWNPAQSTKRV